ncbi:hypothetical protein LXL04_015018 [Taraxacum kok-saghyz]
MQVTITRMTLSQDEQKKRMAISMKAKYDKYWDNGTEKSKEIMGKMSKTLDELFNHYKGKSEKRNVPNTHDNIFGENSSVIGEIDIDLELEFDKFDDGGQEIKSEMKIYLADAREKRDQKFDLLGWWKANSTKFPILSKLARHVLAMPISTVASESAFSTGGRVIDKYRSSLNPETAETLICAQDWIRRSPVDLELGCAMKNRDIDEFNEKMGSLNIDIDLELEFDKFDDGGQEIKSEMKIYLADAREKRDQKFDLLGWWKANSTKFPILSKLARHVLAMPISTVASESAFSTGGRVIDKYRSSLNPETAETLICAQDWIRRSPVDLELGCAMKNRDIDEFNEKMGSLNIDIDLELEFDKFDDGGQEIKSEMKIYLADAREKRDQKFDLLGWWKANSTKFPILSKLARHVLAMPISTVASESAFSTGGRVIDKYRSSLNPETAETLICAQDWIRRSPVDLELGCAMKNRDIDEFNEKMGSLNIDIDLELEFDKFDDGGQEIKSEMKIYLADAREKRDQKFDLLGWWKANSTKFPILSKLARHVLAMPISTVASESAFSTGGRVIDKYRSSLNPETAETLICAQDWIRRSPVDLELGCAMKNRDIDEFNEKMGSLNIDIDLELEFDKFDDGGQEIKSEMKIYLADAREKRDQKFDLLGWWKANSTKFPILSKLARHVLAMPISTVASESAFSTGGRVIDKYRSSLNPETAETLICAQDWIRRSPVDLELGCAMKNRDIDEFNEKMGSLNIGSSSGK